MRQLPRFAALAPILGGLLLASCSTFSLGDDHAHWSYEGATGPEHWGQLSDAYRLASDGRRQSPIDVTRAVDGDAPTLTREYSRIPLRIVNNGHTVQVDGAGGGGLSLGDDRYELVQLHFHAPSEHTLDGVSYPLECHLVHADSDGRLAVLAVLFEEGQESAFLARLFEHLPTTPGPQTVVDGVRLDLDELVPAATATRRYPGSLTTPPCSEGVSWIVCTERASISRDQIDTFHGAYDGNNRPIQPTNDRAILRADESSESSP